MDGRPVSGGDLTDLERRCVMPFYRKMMGLNALNPRYEVPFEDLRQLGRETTDAEVVEMLGEPNWRPQVMGAWLATGRIKRVGTVLLECLETSKGSLTAPPLATVALYGLGTAAVSSLQAYLREDLERHLGSASFVAAVLERLEAAPDGVAIEDRHRIYLDGMLAVARRLETGYSDTRYQFPSDGAVTLHGGGGSYACLRSGGISGRPD